MAAASGVPSRDPGLLGLPGTVIGFLDVKGLGCLGMVSKKAKEFIEAGSIGVHPEVANILRLRGVELGKLPFECQIEKSFETGSREAQEEFLAKKPTLCLIQYFQRLSSGRPVAIERERCNEAFLSLSSLEQDKIFDHITNGDVGRALLALERHQISPSARVKFLTRVDVPATEADLETFTDAEWSIWIRDPRGVMMHGAAVADYLRRSPDRIQQIFRQERSKNWIGNMLSSPSDFPSIIFLVTQFIEFVPVEEWEEYFRFLALRGSCWQIGNPLFSDALQRAHGFKVFFKQKFAEWEGSMSALKDGLAYGGFTPDEFYEMIVRSNRDFFAIDSYHYGRDRWDDGDNFQCFVNEMAPHLSPFVIKNLLLKWNRLYGRMDTVCHMVGVCGRVGDVALRNRVLPSLLDLIVDQRWNEHPAVLEQLRRLLADRADLGEETTARIRRLVGPAGGGAAAGAGARS